MLIEKIIELVKAGYSIRINPNIYRWTRDNVEITISNTFNDLEYHSRYTLFLEDLSLQRKSNEEIFVDILDYLVKDFNNINQLVADYCCNDITLTNELFKSKETENDN